eukprot:4435483-Prymnesium_polylepis.2
MRLHRAPSPPPSRQLLLHDAPVRARLLASAAPRTTRLLWRRQEWVERAARPGNERAARPGNERRRRRRGRRAGWLAARPPPSRRGAARVTAACERRCAARRCHRAAGRHARPADARRAHRRAGDSIRGRLCGAAATAAEARRERRRERWWGRWGRHRQQQDEEARAGAPAEQARARVNGEPRVTESIRACEPHNSESGHGDGARAALPNRGEHGRSQHHRHRTGTHRESRPERTFRSSTVAVLYVHRQWSALHNPIYAEIRASDLAGMRVEDAARTALDIILKNFISLFFSLSLFPVFAA